MPEAHENTMKEQGYDHAVDLLRQCCTEHGFLASLEQRHNYKRIWGRDGALLTIAALLTGEADLIRCGGKTLATLADAQGPHGEIPSNVDPFSGRISYGGTAGRVDSNLWFVIACGEYWHATDDGQFLESMLPVLEKARFLLGAWEYNNRGLLYIPLTGDWADEYVHNGYVLFDQLLYLQALRTLCAIHADFHGTEDHALGDKTSRLHHLIHDNYWLSEDEALPPDVYHELLYRKGKMAASHCRDRYWMPFFSPLGYGYRFDSFANVLASLLGVAEPFQQDAVDRHIESITGNNRIRLLPAFHPVITPRDEDWQDLQMTFSYTFKNNPYEFHNGGLWPLITGFYVADLARRGKTGTAVEFLAAVHRANAMNGDGTERWGFPEYINGRTFEPGGTFYQGWSGAGAIIGHQALRGKEIFSFAP